MNNCDNKAPKSPEEGLQQPACGHFPEQPAQDHGQQGRTAQISPADAEHQLQPPPKGTQDKQKI